LQRAQPDAGAVAVRASYVALDEAQAVIDIEHEAVRDSAERLLHELARERQRIVAGAPLLALGESPVCDTCEARGLCRKDHWSAPAKEGGDGDPPLPADPANRSRRS